ncbi:MAG: hypothetical protein J5509_10285 [Lachnospiraceae bacterium]|nr:hypothetical protein [Lachnospiraceae bacterium]
MKKILIPIIGVIVLAAIATGVIIFMRMNKIYTVGEDPKLSEITRITYTSGMQSADYGYIYDTYTISTRDQKYYAETDMFDEEKGEQVVSKIEMTRPEYTAILSLIDGCQFAREGRKNSGVMDGFMDSSSYYAEIMWPRRPDGAWHLLMDSGMRQAYAQAVEDVTRTINISFTDNAEPGSVWILRDTEENRKISLWGTAMIKPDTVGTEVSADIPYAEDAKYLFRMIDDDGIYYSGDIPELRDDWKLDIHPIGEYWDFRLDVYDENGELRYECELFNAAL